MKEELLKSVAKPMQIFYAPFNLFCFNFFFICFLIILVFLFNLTVYIWVPIVFFIINHFILIYIAMKEPHIDSILLSRSNIKTKTNNLIKEKGNKFSF